MHGFLDFVVVVLVENFLVDLLLSVGLLRIGYCYILLDYYLQPYIQAATDCGLLPYYPHRHFLEKNSGSDYYYKSSGNAYWQSMGYCHRSCYSIGACYNSAKVAVVFLLVGLFGLFVLEPLTGCRSLHNRLRGFRTGFLLGLAPSYHHLLIIKN